MKMAWHRLTNPLQQRLEAQLLPYYQQLQPREQRLLLAAAVVLPLLLLIFGIMLPLHDRHQALQTQLAQAQQQAAEAMALANMLQSQGGQQAQVADGNLLTQVESLARATQVRSYMTRIKPQAMPNSDSERLMLQMKDVPYAALLRFMHQLAAAHAGFDNVQIRRAEHSGVVQFRALISR